MELIERYLQAVGRLLPHQQRDDILSELRSSLYDSLEQGDHPISEEAVIKAIKALGSPEKAAAAYYPAGQYVIGPALYPTFRLVLGIVFTVLVVLQLVSIAASLGYGMPSLLGGIGNLLQTLPSALGSVVVVFWILQRLEVNPTAPNTEFDPRKLPPVEANPASISRPNLIFEIVLNVFILGLLARFAQQGGVSWIDGSRLFENPVIEQYFPWIVVAVVADIGLQILLLWRGFWQRSTRIADLVSNLFSFGLIWLLFQGHQTWIANAGLPSFFESFKNSGLTDNTQIGMLFFRGFFGVAAIISLVTCVVCAYRVYQSFTNSAKSSTPDPLLNA